MAQIEKIGVIGAGNMGSGIAQKIAQEGLHVVMVDLKAEFVERGLGIIKQTLQEGVQRKIFKPEHADEIFSRVTGTTDFEDVADADLVIEAVFEDKNIKSDLFKNLDQICSRQTILATNTSSFFVKEFAEQTSRPDRFVGLHYFYHPAKNRLLEVIPHDGTSTETLEKSLLAAKLHAKTAIVQQYPDFNMPRILAKQKELGQPFEFNFVDLEIKNNIAYVTFNRPEAMNALNETVISQLDNRFSEAEGNPEVKAVIFQGAGKAFVAGADIRYFVNKIKADRIQDIYDFTRKGHEVFLKIENSEKITIALKLVNEIIDQQTGQSIDEAIDIEMGYLNEIFSTADALEGLSTMGRKKPEFKGA